MQNPQVSLRIVGLPGRDNTPQASIFEEDFVAVILRPY